MTDAENRLHELEVRFGDADSRQESFETFVRAYMKNNSEQMQRMEQRMEQRMDKMDQRMDKMDQRMDKMEATTKAQIDRVVDKMEDIGKEVRSIGRYVNALVATTVVGVAAMVWSMVSFLGSIKP